MKKIGLIDGMNWGATIPYYKMINDGIHKRLGKNHSAKSIVYSFDFQEIEELQYNGDWKELENKILYAGKTLKENGADFVVLCTNTMHKVVDDFERVVGIPLLHIADAVGQNITQQGIKKIGLLGTIITMEEDFYKKRLETKFGLTVTIPNEEDRKIINNIIYTELVQGVTRPSSNDAYLKIMDKMKDIQGVILGCSEMGLLIKDYHLPLFDSTLIHAEAAVEYSLR